METKSLVDKQTAEIFYEERYQDGYMDEWPAWKKQRVVEIIQSLKLPETGFALDFGCGNGVFTDVLKKALPNWTIYGSDISETALINARKRYTNCNFIVFEDILPKGLSFQFVLSHHVLEHVYNLEVVLEDLAKVISLSGKALHIMPCGNKGSFEYELASSISGGIDVELGNRFYYEDTGHLRRLSSDDLSNLMKAVKFEEIDGWFANQKYGALEWMSDYPLDFIINELTPEKRGKDNKSKEKIIALRTQIIDLKKARLLAKEGFKHQIKTAILQFAKHPTKIFGLINAFSLISMGKSFQQSLDNEWKNSSKLENGSEMYMLYKKS